MSTVESDRRRNVLMNFISSPPVKEKRQEGGKGTLLRAPRSKYLLNSEPTSEQKLPCQEVVKFAKNGGRIIAASEKFLTYDSNILIMVVDKQTKGRAKLRGHLGLVKDLKINPNSSLLAACDSEGFIYIWDISAPFTSSTDLNPSVILSFSNAGSAAAPFRRVLWSPSQTHLLAIANDASVYVWNISHLLQLAQSDTRVEIEQSAPDHHISLSLSEHESQSHSNPSVSINSSSDLSNNSSTRQITDAAYFHDDFLLLSDSLGTIHVWNFSQQKFVHQFFPFRTTSFSFNDSPAQNGSSDSSKSSKFNLIDSLYLSKDSEFLISSLNYGRMILVWKSASIFLSEVPLPTQVLVFSEPPPRSDLAESSVDAQNYVSFDRELGLLVRSSEESPVLRILHFVGAFEGFDYLTQFDTVKQNLNICTSLSGLSRELEIHAIQQAYIYSYTASSSHWLPSGLFSVSESTLGIQKILPITELSPEDQQNQIPLEENQIQSSQNEEETSFPPPISSIFTSPPSSSMNTNQMNSNSAEFPSSSSVSDTVNTISDSTADLSENLNSVSIPQSDLSSKQVHPSEFSLENILPVQSTTNDDLTEENPDSSNLTLSDDGNPISVPLLSLLPRPHDIDIPTIDSEPIQISPDSESKEELPETSQPSSPTSSIPSEEPPSPSQSVTKQTSVKSQTNSNAREKSPAPSPISSASTTKEKKRARRKKNKDDASGNPSLESQPVPMKILARPSPKPDSSDLSLPSGGGGGESSAAPQTTNKRNNSSSNNQSKRTAQQAKEDSSHSQPASVSEYSSSTSNGCWKTLESNLYNRLEKTVLQQMHQLVVKLNERERRERELSQAIVESITSRLEKAIHSEIQSLVPVLTAKLTQTVSGDKFFTRLSDHVRKGVQEAQGNQVRSLVQAEFRSNFEKTLAPAFEQACQKMFVRMNSAFQQGLQQHFQQLTLKETSESAGHLSNVLSHLTNLSDSLLTPSGSNSSSIPLNMDRRSSTSQPGLPLEFLPSPAKNPNVSGKSPSAANLAGISFPGGESSSLMTPHSLLPPSAHVPWIGLPPNGTHPPSHQSSFLPPEGNTQFGGAPNGPGGMFHPAFYPPMNAGLGMAGYPGGPGGLFPSPGGGPFQRPPAQTPPSAPSGSGNALQSSSLPAIDPVVSPNQPVPQGAEEMLQLISAGKCDEAFNKILSARDLNLLVFVCSRLQRNEASTTAKLSQPVLLVLIKQLGYNLDSNLGLKLRWLQACLSNLKVHDSAVVTLVRSILTPIVQVLDVRAPTAGSDSDLLASVRNLVGHMLLSVPN